jgi:hypothetical protein
MNSTLLVAAIKNHTDKREERCHQDFSQGVGVADRKFAFKLV